MTCPTTLTTAQANRCRLAELDRDDMSRLADLAAVQASGLADLAGAASAAPDIEAAQRAHATCRAAFLALAVTLGQWHGTADRATARDRAD